MTPWTTRPIDTHQMVQSASDHILVPLRSTDRKEDQDQEDDDQPLEPRSLVDDPVPELVNLDQLVSVPEFGEIPLELLVLDGSDRIGIGDLDF